MNRKYHYTTLEDWHQILADGQIRPSTIAVEKHERLAVWFSTNTHWEPTATKGIIDRSTGELRDATWEEMIHIAGGLVRIAVADGEARYTWLEFKALSGIRPCLARALYRAALTKRAKPSEWFVAFGSVPCERWTCVEMWTAAGWTPMPHWRTFNDWLAMASLCQDDTTHGQLVEQGKAIAAAFSNKGQPARVA